MSHISLETPADADETEALFDLAFAPGRGALSSYRLRAGVTPVSDLCFVMRDDYWVIVGAIRYWPITIGATDPTAPALLLGPIAVHPTRQGEGLGAALIQRSLDRAKTLGWTRVVLIGDEPYYRRFGFSRAQAENLVFPAPTNPKRVLAAALEPDAFHQISGPVRRAANFL